MADAHITESGGNVFADLGLPDAEELLVKAKLSYRIAHAIQARGLTQTEAAALICAAGFAASAKTR